MAIGRLAPPRKSNRRSRSEQPFRSDAWDLTGDCGTLSVGEKIPPVPPLRSWDSRSGIRSAQVTASLGGAGPAPAKLFADQFVLEDKRTLGNLASLRANKPRDLFALDPSVAAITKNGVSDPNAAHQVEVDAGARRRR